MKPIFLSICGLNSFREEQRIDFEALSETGMFGIFGPTGSGKSTILDAMTLALYGEVVRAGNHTQGILNHAEKKLYVGFEFSVGAASALRKFRVERHYKRGDDVSVLHHASRILELHASGESTVLADTKSEVTKRIREILGLEPEDFTRAVVLPQGKFSEFLRLSGAERNRMTERLFGFERYGQRLVERLAGLDRTTKTELDTVVELQQQLGDASDVALDQAQKQVKESEEKVRTAQIQKLAAEARLSEGKRIRQLAAELAKAERALAFHTAGDGEIRLLERSLEAAHRAKSVVTVLDEAERATAALSAAVRENEEAEVQLFQCVAQAAAADAERQSAFATKAQEERPLLARVEKLRLAEHLERELAQVQSMHAKLVEQMDAQSERLAGLTQSEEILSAHLELTEQSMRRAQEDLNRLMVSRSERAVADRLRPLAQTLQSVTQGLEVAQTQVQDRKYRLNQLERELAEVTHRLSALQARQAVAATQMEVSSPAEETVIQHIHYVGLRLRERLETVRHSEEAVVRAQDVLAGASQQRADAYAVQREAERDRKALEERLHALTTLKWREVEEDRLRMARRLAEEIRNGEPCPVCGSQHHPNPATQAPTPESEALNDVASESWEDAQRALHAQEAVCREALALVERYAAAEAVATEGLTRVKEAWAASLDAMRTQGSVLGDAVAQTGLSLPAIEVSVDAGWTVSRYEEVVCNLDGVLEGLRGARQVWERQRAEAASALEEVRTGVHDEERAYAALQAAFQAASDELTRAREAVATALETEDRLTVELQSLLEEIGDRRQPTGVDESVGLLKTALVWLQSIANRQEESALCQERLNQERRAFDEGTQQRRDLDRELSALREAVASASVEVARTESAAKDIADKLKDLTLGSVSVLEALQLATESLDRLQVRVDAAERTWQTAQNDLQAAKITQATTEERWQRAVRDEADAQRKLQAQLYEAQFVSAEEARDACLLDSEMETGRRRVESHREKGADLARETRRLQESLGDNAVSDEAWTDLCMHMDQANQAHDDAMRNRGIVEQSLNNLLERRAKWLELETRRSQLHGDWEKITDLRTTLRGNSFVEYLAKEQLESVARDASARLGRLTRGRYALEVMSDGGFVMCDHHNGGVRRPVTTLSGGETFLTSLSLALSLSSQIQLRGQYPLEFFFLDEGFGTLDPELLDVVISTLEQLHMERIAIGVISHTPELRQRLQRRLIVEPAEPAGRGSRVKVEMA